MKMRYGFSGDISEIATRSIRWASGGAYPHCFVVFYQAFDLVSGTQEDKGVYFASRVSKFIDQATKKTKTGVRGPRSIDVVRKWAAGDPDKRYWELLPAEGSGKFLPFTEDEVWAAYNMCCESVHTVSYAKLQIFQDLIAQKTGIRIGRGNKDNYKESMWAMAVVLAALEVIGIVKSEKDELTFISL